VGRVLIGQAARVRLGRQSPREGAGRTVVGFAVDRPIDTRVRRPPVDAAVVAYCGLIGGSLQSEACRKPDLPFDYTATVHAHDGGIYDLKATDERHTGEGEQNSVWPH
jgi:hypothetical protein